MKVKFGILPLGHSLSIRNQRMGLLCQHILLHQLKQQIHMLNIALGRQKEDYPM